MGILKSPNIPNILGNVGKTIINHQSWNGRHTTYKNCDLEDGLLHLFTSISIIPELNPELPSGNLTVCY